MKKNAIAKLLKNIGIKVSGVIFVSVEDVGIFGLVFENNYRFHISSNS